MKADDLTHPYTLAIKVQVVYLNFLSIENKFLFFRGLKCLILSFNKQIIGYKHVYRKGSIEPRNARTDETPLIDLKNGFAFHKIKIMSKLIDINENQNDEKIKRVNFKGFGICLETKTNFWCPSNNNTVIDQFYSIF